VSEIMDIADAAVPKVQRAFVAGITQARKAYADREGEVAAMLQRKDARGVAALVEQLMTEALGG
jgi:hypothetical protein